MGLWFIYICIALMLVCENVGNNKKQTATKNTEK